VADGGDTGRLGPGFGGDVTSRFATPCEAERAGAALGAGSPITISSKASGAAAKTSHDGPGRKPAVARNNVNAAMCNRIDVSIATNSSDTGHERVAMTALARGAFFGVGGAVMSPGHYLSSSGTARLLDVTSL